MSRGFAPSSVIESPDRLFVDTGRHDCNVHAGSTQHLRPCFRRRGQYDLSALSGRGGHVDNPDMFLSATQGMDGPVPGAFAAERQMAADGLGLSTDGITVRQRCRAFRAKGSVDKTVHRAFRKHYSVCI